MRGDARHALDKVEGDTLCLQDTLRGPFDGGENRGPGKAFPIVHMKARAYVGISQRHSGDEDVFAAQGAGFARH